MGGRPLGDVRVGVSTLFARDQMTPELRPALLISSIGHSRRHRHRGHRLVRDACGRWKPSPRALTGWRAANTRRRCACKRKDEWGILSSKLNLLGEKMRGERRLSSPSRKTSTNSSPNSPRACCLFDLDDRLVLATPAVARFLGRAPEDLAHRRAAEMFATSHPSTPIWRRRFARGKPGHGRWWSSLRTAKSSRRGERAIRRRARQETSPAWSPLRDAGTRAQIEDQIDATTKLAAIGRLTSGVAHEVKNPLNAMVLALEIIRRRGLAATTRG